MLGRIEALRVTTKFIDFPHEWTVESFVFPEETQIVKNKLLKIIRRDSVSQT
jgi:hypothetical protein